MWVVAQSAAPHKTIRCKRDAKRKRESRIASRLIFKTLHLLGLHVALVDIECQMKVGKLPTACQRSDMPGYAEAADQVVPTLLVSSWCGTVAMRLQMFFCSKSIGGGIEAIHRLRQIYDAIP